MINTNKPRDSTDGEPACIQIALTQATAAERKRVLDWITYNNGSYRNGTKERQVLEMLYKQVQGGEQPPQVRML